jgi:hypothetical protein
MQSTVTPPATHSILLNLASYSSYRRLTIVNNSATNYKVSPNGGTNWVLSLAGTAMDIDAYLLGAGFGNTLIEGSDAHPAGVDAWVI